MTASIPCRIMDALALRLNGIPGVATFTLDPARVLSETDGVVITLEQGKQDDTDKTNDACWITSGMTVVISIYVPRPQTLNQSVPGDKSTTPVWQLTDLFYREVHSRMMADLATRQVNGLAIDTTPINRQRDSDATVTVLRAVYSVTYRTRHHDITQ